MSKGKGNRNRWLNMRFTEEEHKKIAIGFSNSTKRTISEYGRSILLDKPVTVYTRNQSFDDFVTEIILLKAELKAIGNNFNQAVRKLHTISCDTEIKTWAIHNEITRDKLFKKVEEINLKIASISDKWSQE